MQFIATVVVASFLVLSQSPLLVDSTRFKVNVTITCWHRRPWFYMVTMSEVDHFFGNKDDQIDTEGVKVTTQETVSFFLEGVQEDDELYSSEYEVALRVVSDCCPGRLRRFSKNPYKVDMNVEHDIRSWDVNVSVCNQSVPVNTYFE
ncbi:hypothetical protein L3Y34_013741 [Caenorhabditis briggsae]|uniref:Uncharacterized protein n=1 Tax=Caenorhabditis briggsae TaxID=6238 RepID=A0AAE9CY86_CAEBR|nr:hypothetical protein L3Y34_013741 [Caenorhabditis briggsae]